MCPADLTSDKRSAHKANKLVRSVEQTMLFSICNEIMTFLCVNKISFMED